MRGLPIPCGKICPKSGDLLVVQRGETCVTQVCQQQLYQTRQIHVALGKDFNRVGRRSAAGGPLGVAVTGTPLCQGESLIDAPQNLY